MNTLAVIPARLASSRLPEKVVRPLAGKPMLHYTVEAALACQRVTVTCLVSEDDAIRDICADYGIDFVRDVERARDEPLTAVAATVHALEAERDLTTRFPDRVVMLLPTSPLRTWLHIEEALTLHDTDPRANVVSCVSDPPRHGTLEFRSSGPSWRKSPSARSNGAIQIASTDRLLREREFVKGKTLPYFMDRRSSVDVDTLADFELAESYMREVA